MDRTPISISTLTTPEVNGLEEIAGMRHLKKLLSSMILRPRTQPQLFKNHKICNTILLYGPPGTGKTTLVHATAATTNSLLHCVCASDLLSPYVGGTEKNIKVLFDHLRQSDDCAIIFFDELDGFCMKRTSSENDYSRRLKTELMVQLSKIDSYRNIIFIAATNRPWDLDSAILRRFKRRFYVPLPTIEERDELLQLYTKDIEFEGMSSDIWQFMLEITEGFSGCDISNLVQQALDVPILELEDTDIWVQDDTDGYYKPLNDKNRAASIENIVFSDINELPDGSVKARPLAIGDFMLAVGGITTSVSPEEVKMFESFAKQQK